MGRGCLVLVLMDPLEGFAGVRMGVASGDALVRRGYNPEAMMIETRTTIELKDVLALEIGCKHCGAVTIERVREVHHIPISCPNCTAELLDMDGSTKRAIEELVRILKHPALIEEKGNFTLRLHINAPSE